MQIHLENIQATFVYQGYRVKVKVTGTRCHRSVTRHTHSLKSRVVRLRLKSSVISVSFHVFIARTQIVCQLHFMTLSFYLEVKR